MGMPTEPDGMGADMIMVGDHILDVPDDPTGHDPFPEDKDDDTSSTDSNKSDASTSTSTGVEDTDTEVGNGNTGVGTSHMDDTDHPDTLADQFDGAVAQGCAASLGNKPSHQPQQHQKSTCILSMSTHQPCCVTCPQAEVHCNKNQ